MIRKYRKKPVVVEAVKWTGENRHDIIELVNPSYPWPSHMPNPVPPLKFEKMGDSKKEALYINTLEGEMYAAFGDYVIKGVNGELYPCKPDIFEKTYELVEE